MAGEPDSGDGVAIAAGGLVLPRSRAKHRDIGLSPSGFGLRPLLDQYLALDGSDHCIAIRRMDCGASLVGTVVVQ
ncbi:MAG TPA: hypothetical protein VF135_06305 [Terriglobales bacterium]